MSADGDGRPTRGGEGLTSHERDLLEDLEARARQDDPDLDTRMQVRRRFQAASHLPDWKLSAMKAPRWNPTEMPIWVAAIGAALGLVGLFLAVSSAVWLSIPAIVVFALGFCRLSLGVSQAVAAHSDKPGNPHQLP